MGTVTFLMPFNYIQDEISINLKAIFPQIKKKKNLEAFLMTTLHMPV